jgi:hypothetical protein
VKNNCVLLSKKEDYINRDSKLKFICSCGRIGESSFSSFKLSRHCKQCGLDKYSKENHYCWKGGISPLHEYLRDKIYNWKRDSLIL